MSAVGTSRPSPAWLVVPEFLSPLELIELHSYISCNEGSFQASKVISQRDGRTTAGEHESRRSRVLFATPFLESMFFPALQRAFPYACTQLGIPRFDIDHIELQVTASRTGDYFRAHRDNGHERTNGRVLTYVYYGHREPAQFSGGALRFCGSHGRVHDITPEQNTVVFFTSDKMHEVLPVHGVSTRVVDARLTVNGWYWRSGSPRTGPLA